MDLENCFVVGSRGHASALRGQGGRQMSVQPKVGTGQALNARMLGTPLPTNLGSYIRVIPWDPMDPGFCEVILSYDSVDLGS